jgi:hypothetical protein
MARMSADEVADLQTVYYLGRDRTFPEHYESILKHFKKVQALEKDLRSQINQVMEKTNFLQAFRDGASTLGRLGLTERLKDY